MVRNSLQQTKLHIGYLLPEWREETIEFFRTQLFTEYNEEAFEVYGYLLKGHMKFYQPWKEKSGCVWKDLSQVKAAEAAQVMQKDKIDILVDLSIVRSVVAENVLRRRLAPVQAAFIGFYPLEEAASVDYWLTDKYCDPVGRGEEAAESRLYRLPYSHFCYQPSEAVEEEERTPFKRNGFVTFCSLHYFTLLDDSFLTLWGEILREVPHAKLALKNRAFGSGHACEETRHRLKRLGIPVERVVFFSNEAEDGELYRNVDILLDTYPCQGGKSTCEALHHGIPLVSLTGKRRSMRFGYSILKNISLREYAAFSPEEYVRKAVTLARNPYKLAYLRRNLRERLRKSPLTDVPRYMRNVESAYQQMWLRLQMKKKRASVWPDILQLLRTVEVAFVYIEENAEKERVLIEQMMADIQIAFAKLNTTFQDMGFCGSAKGMLLECAGEMAPLKRLYASKNMTSFHGRIRTFFLPHIRDLMEGELKHPPC